MTLDAVGNLLIMCKIVILSRFDEAVFLSTKKALQKKLGFFADEIPDLPQLPPSSMLLKKEW